MSTLVWSEEYSINVAEIDAQHKELLEHVNKLHAAVEAQLDKRDLHRLFLDLVEYVKFHFASEERLMTEYGMANMGPHHRDHMLLLEQLEQIVEDIAEGRNPAFYSEYDVSNDWFLAHICGYDKRLGEFLNSKGLY